MSQLPAARKMVCRGMRWNLPFALAKAAMVLMVALGLLLAGFSHHPALSSDQIDQAVYLAEMGLTPADLCAESGDAGGKMAMGDCPACHLAAAPHFPEPVAGLIDIDLRAAAAILVPARVRGAGRTTNPATPVRAPPLA